MWYPATETVPPASEPVTRQEIKKQVRAEYHTDDDAYLDLLIAAGRDHVERYCGVVFAPRLVEVKCTGWCDLDQVPVSPIVDMDIAYVDSDGVSQVVDEADYEVRGSGVVFVGEGAWPTIKYGTLITLTIEAGAEIAPAAVKHAIRLWVASSYDVREDAPSGGRTAFDDLLTNFRR